MDSNITEQQITTTHGGGVCVGHDDLCSLAPAGDNNVQGGEGNEERQARIDYLSVLLRAPHDYCQQIIAAVQADCEEWGVAGGLNLAPRIRAHGALPSGDRGYTLEWYGLASDCVAKLLPQHLLSQASRVDYRQEHEPVTEASIEAFGRYVRMNQKGNRNVSTFSSRPRAKRDGRSAGGIGVALGSHKSDTRLSVYKRKDERGAIEIQYSGKALDDAKTDAAKMMRVDKCTWYEAISVILCNRLDVQAKQAGFDDSAGMCFYLREENIKAEDAEGGEEFAAYQFTQWYTGLPYHKQIDVLRGLHITPAVLAGVLTGLNT